MTKPWIKLKSTYEKLFKPSQSKEPPNKLVTQNGLSQKTKSREQIDKAFSNLEKL